MINGVDLGNYNVKPSESNPITKKQIIFPSKICKDRRTIQLRKPTDENLVVLQEEKYLVGEGEFQTDPNKLDKELYKICFLTALARSTVKDSEEFQVVTGLPANQYTERNKERLKNEILKDRIYTLYIGGQRRTLILQDLEIFPENAAPYYGMTKEQKALIGTKDLILVNIGGGNTNIAYFKNYGGKRKLQKGNTIMSGVLNLYSDFINAINGEFSINLKLEDAESILKEGLEIYGEKQDLSFTKEIIIEHTEKIFKEINLYPLKTSKIMFTGGGSKVLKPVIQSRIKGCLFQTNFLTATVQGFKKVGEALWQKESL